MKRRDFLFKSALAVSGPLVCFGADKSSFSQGDRPVPQFTDDTKSHPLYFDGLILEADNEEVGGQFRSSGLSGFVWDVSSVTEVDGKYVRPFLPCLKSIARANAFLRNNGIGLFMATKGSQIEEARNAGKMAVFLQFQSCEPFVDDLELMEVFYELGLRICQVTHHSTNPFGGGSLEKHWTGLTDIGFKAIEKMDELKIIPDLSHGNQVLCQDVLKTSKRPVVTSHTCCRAIVNNARCITDDIIKGVADSGGIVGIMPLSWWITKEPVPTVDHYLNHIAHVINVGGIDTVGLSNDQTVAGHLESAKLGNNIAEAIKPNLPWWNRQKEAGILGFEEPPAHYVIPELNNVRRHFTIQAALEKRGYSSAQVEKIMGKNWRRVLTDSLG